MKLALLSSTLHLQRGCFSRPPVICSESNSCWTHPPPPQPQPAQPTTRSLLAFPNPDTLPPSLNIAPPTTGPGGTPAEYLKVSLADLAKFPANLAAPAWPEFSRAVEAWRKLEKIVFNPIFESIVWCAFWGSVGDTL